MHIGSSVDTSAMSRVQEGMRVVDAAGEDLGKVEYLQMGDPEAVTTEGNEHRPDDLVGQVMERALPDESEPDVPDPLRAELQRTGYLKIGGHGIGGQGTLRFQRARQCSLRRDGPTQRPQGRSGQRRLKATIDILMEDEEQCHAESRKVASVSVSTSTSKTATRIVACQKARPRSAPRAR